MGMVAILINWPWPIEQIYINKSLHVKFEENWPRSFRAEAFQMIDDRWQVITRAHPEPLAQVN